MNKKLLLGNLLAIGLVAVIAMMATQNQDQSQDEAYAFSSRNEALVKGLQETTGEAPGMDVINTWVIETKENGSKEYCLIAVPYEEADTKKHFAFVALIEERDGKYAFFKLTADVALNSPGDIQDREKTDSLIFFFDDVAGYYISVGKVFREGVVPYANGSPLAVNADGIFSYFGKGERPEITIH